MWLMEQKMFLLGQIIDIRDEPAQPGPARPGPTRPGHDAALDGLFLKRFFSPNPNGPTIHYGYRLYGTKEKKLFHKPHRKNQQFPRYRVV